MVASMWFKTWRKKRKLAKFKSIITLQSSRNSTRFQPVFLSAKTILKECHTTRIEKPCIQKKMYHSVTLYSNYHQSILQITSGKLCTSTYSIGNAKKRHGSNKTTYLNLNIIKNMVQKSWDAQMLEDQNYDRYHPYEAKQRAKSYLKSLEDHKLIDTHGLYRNKSRNQELFQDQSKPTMQLRKPMSLNRYSPLFRKETTSLCHTSLKQKSHEDEPPIQEKKVSKQDQAISEVIEKKEMKNLVIAVYKEIEKKLYYEKCRKGRR